MTPVVDGSIARRSDRSWEPCCVFFLRSPREIRAEKDKQRTIRTGRNKFNTNPKDVSSLGCSWVKLCWEGALANGTRLTLSVRESKHISFGSHRACIWLASYTFGAIYLSTGLVFYDTRCHLDCCEYVHIVCFSLSPCLSFLTVIQLLT